MTLETQSAFARRLGMHKSHVTRLKQAGRLVMRDGRVVVEDSLQLIADTESAGPAEVANREQHALLRAQRASEDGAHARSNVGLEKQHHQMRKVAAEADLAELERDRRAGELAEVQAIRGAISDIAARIRAHHEGLADLYAPEFTAILDQGEMHAAIEEMIATLQESVAHEIAQLPDKLNAA